MSLYRDALGDDFELLHPQLRRFFGSAPVRAEGVFDEVGVHHRWLVPVFRALARVGLLFADHDTGVPFRVSIEQLSAHRLATERRIRFPRGERVMADETHLVGGRIVDVHAGGRILVRMEPRVLDGGSLRMVATATRLRVASVLLWVPTVPITVTQRWDDTERSQHIDASVRLPLLGEVFGYRGTFRQH